MGQRQAQHAGGETGKRSIGPDGVRFIEACRRRSAPFPTGQFAEQIEEMRESRMTVVEHEMNAAVDGYLFDESRSGDVAVADAGVTSCRSVEIGRNEELFLSCGSEEMERGRHGIGEDRRVSQSFLFRASAVNRETPK